MAVAASRCTSLALPANCPRDRRRTRSDGPSPSPLRAAHRPAEDVAALLAAGADVAAKNNQGFTALHFACQENRLDVVEVLLDAGAPVDPVDQWGNTPLWRAVFNANGNARVVRRLVLAGADPDKANASSKTPRELATTIANYDTSEYFDIVDSP